MTDAVPEPRIESGRIWCPLLNDWRLDQPEERVRQSFIEHLHQTYGYAYGQMRQEQRTQHGTRSPRVDVAVWATEEDAKQTPRPAPVLVVECKAESVNIHPRDYYQGESYARAVGEPCEFLVMHNARQTAVFRLRRGLPGELVQINNIPKAEDWGDARRLREIRESQREFNRKEFQDLLFQAHSILRDNHKMQPGEAFDVISKVLFIKMYVERTGTHGTFTTGFLDRREKDRLEGDQPVHERLFALTKKHYASDEIFAEDDTLDISAATFRRIVGKLERFNLSATGEDIKGLAFERFLGKTYRGELGQYFTPRPIVDFMVKVVDPEEGELICDPAAGSGGFLIHAFEYVRSKIEADIQAKKDVLRSQIEEMGLDEAEEETRIEAAFAELNRELDPDEKNPPSRLRRLSRDYIFGTDAAAQAARTAKMNMIMHGDGHGGIHYHDGLVDVNGIFPGRFNVVLSNPPFGSNVGEDQIVGETEQTRGPFDEALVKRAKARYGAGWQVAHDALLAKREDGRRVNKDGDLPILGLYEIGVQRPNRPTELLFLERCLQLLTPGGRLGIVLPDGNLNNPSLGWLRRWAEGKARLVAVVSLPEDTFRSADATVKASLVFLRRFTAADQDAWNAAWEAAHEALDDQFAQERDAAVRAHSEVILTGGNAEIGSVLADLEALDAGREGPGWRMDDPPEYPRGVLSSNVTNPRWVRLPTGKKNADRKAQAKVLRSRYAELWTDACDEAQTKATKALRRTLRKIDTRHSAALWDAVREALDYPVFTAAPTAVGVTSTGAEGANELPEVLADYHQFRTWLEAGADPALMPALDEDRTEA